MSEIERAAVAGLCRCTFLPTTWDKRFVRALAQHDSTKPLSEKQQEWLWKLVWKYRRQIEDTVLIRHAQRQIDPNVAQAEQLPLELV